MGIWEDYRERLTKAERFDYLFVLTFEKENEKPAKRKRQTPGWLIIESEKIRMEGRIEAAANEHFEDLIHHYDTKKRNLSESINLKLTSQLIPINPEAYSSKKRDVKKLEREGIPHACRGKYKYSNVSGGVFYCGFRKPGYRTCPARSNISFPVQSKELSRILVGGSEHACNYRH